MYGEKQTHTGNTAQNQAIKRTATIPYRHESTIYLSRLHYCTATHLIILTPHWNVSILHTAHSLWSAARTCKVYTYTSFIINILPEAYRSSCYLGVCLSVI